MSENSARVFMRRGLEEEIKALKDDGLDDVEATRVAATTMDGAGENPVGTVESMATCYDIEGRKVKGVTGNDSATARKDEFSVTERSRRAAAEKGIDPTEKWLQKNDPNYGQNRGSWS